MFSFTALLSRIAESHLSPDKTLRLDVNYYRSRSVHELIEQWPPANSDAWLAFWLALEWYTTRDGGRYF